VLERPPPGGEEMSQQDEANVLNRLKVILTAEQDRGNTPIPPSTLLELIFFIEQAVPNLLKLVDSWEDK